MNSFFKLLGMCIEQLFSPNFCSTLVFSVMMQKVVIWRNTFDQFSGPAFQSSSKMRTLFLIVTVVFSFSKTLDCSLFHCLRYLRQYYGKKPLARDQWILCNLEFQIFILGRRETFQVFSWIVTSDLSSPWKYYI
jgi:hypothetical protein